MAWFKKFVEEVKTEWKRINNVEENKHGNSNELKEKLIELENEIKKELVTEEMIELQQHITNQLALANIGVERYGRPTITYKGKKYNAKILLNLTQDKDILTMDEIIMCKMMVFKINEQIDEIAKRDEDGEILRYTDDEVLDAYLIMARSDVYRLEYVLKNTK